MSDDFSSRLAGLLETAASHDEYPQPGQVLRGARARMRRRRLARSGAVCAAVAVLVAGSYVVVGANTKGPLVATTPTAGPTVIAGPAACPAAFPLEVMRRSLGTTAGPLVGFTPSSAAMCRFGDRSGSGDAPLKASALLGPEDAMTLAERLNALTNYDGKLRFCPIQFTGGDILVLVGSGQREEVFITNGGCRYVSDPTHARFSNPALEAFITAKLG